MKTKHKAVKRWADPKDVPTDRVFMVKERFVEDSPYYLIPATPEAYDAQVEASCKALYTDSKWNPPWSRIDNDEAEEVRKDVRIILAAIGIKRPSAKEGEKTL